MFTFDNDEKTVLVHLVSETSANIFFQAAHQAITAYGETNYCEIHAMTDEKHEKMGQELLKNMSQARLERLLIVQQQGWDMLNTTCDRIAKIAVQA